MRFCEKLRKFALARLSFTKSKLILIASPVYAEEREPVLRGSLPVKEPPSKQQPW